MRPPRVLIIVQNLPVPLDRRVWLEAQALTAAGYEVSVICPKGPGRPRAAGARRGRHLQVPPGARGERPARVRRRVRVLVAAHRAACRWWCGASAGSTSSRRATRRTPTGCWRSCGASPGCASSSTTTTSTPSCSARGSVSRGRPGRARSTPGCSGSSGARSGRRTGSSRPTSRTAASPWSAVGCRASTRRSCAAARTPAGCGRSYPSRIARAADTCWSTSGSWARRTTCTWCSRSWTSWSACAGDGTCARRCSASGTPSRTCGGSAPRSGSTTSSSSPAGSGRARSATT